MGKIGIWFYILSMMFMFQACDKRDREIRRLKIESSIKYKQEIWRDACLNGVAWSCYYADCAMVSIEEMQVKICQYPPEDL
jgi:hypothetical protein